MVKIIKSTTEWFQQYSIPISYRQSKFNHVLYKNYSVQQSCQLIQVHNKLSCIYFSVQQEENYKHKSIARSSIKFATRPHCITFKTVNKNEKPQSCTKYHFRVFRLISTLRQFHLLNTQTQYSKKISNNSVDMRRADVNFLFVSTTTTTTSSDNTTATPTPTATKRNNNNSIKLTSQEISQDNPKVSSKTPPTQ